MARLCSCKTDDFFLKALVVCLLESVDGGLGSQSDMVTVWFFLALDGFWEALSASFEPLRVVFDEDVFSLDCLGIRPV